MGWARVIAVVVALSACFYGGWKLHKYQTESEALKNLNKAIEIYNEKLLQLQQESVEFEKFKVLAAQERDSLKKKVINAIKTDVRYTCVVPADGLLAILQSVAAANAR